MFGVLSVNRGMAEELNTFLLLSAVGRNRLEYREHGFQWNTTFVDDVFLARTVTRTCTNSVSVASPRLDTQFNLNVTPYFLFYFNHFQAVRFVANVRLFIGPNLEGPF